MFPGLPSIPGFAPIGGGGIGLPKIGIGSGYPIGGPIQINVPVGGGGGVVVGGSAGTGSAPNATSVGFNPLSGLGLLFGTGASVAGNILLRLVLIIIGILCIAGAIYLFKPSSSNVLSVPINALKSGAKVAAETAE